MSRLGEWYFPNGTQVPGMQGLATSFYRTRRDDGTVTLSRLNTDDTMPSGLFCCQVPDAKDATLYRLCVDIGELHNKI